MLDSILTFLGFGWCANPKFTEEGHFFQASVTLRKAWILPNVWLTNFYGQQLRKYLLDCCQILVAVNLEPVDVFADAIVDTVILIARKQNDEAVRLENQVKVYEGNQNSNIEFKHSVNQSMWVNDLGLIFNLLSGDASTKLLGKLDSLSLPLGEFCSFSQGIIPYTTAEESKNNPYTSNNQKTPDWKPLLDSGDCVSKYSLNWHNQYIYYGSWLARR